MSFLFPSSPSTILPQQLPPRPATSETHLHHYFRITTVNIGPSPLTTTTPPTLHFIVLVTSAALQAAITGFPVSAMLLEKEHIAVAPRRSSLPSEPMARLRIRKKESRDATPSSIPDLTVVVCLMFNGLRSRLLHQHLQPLPVATSVTSSLPLDRMATSVAPSLCEPDVVVWWWVGIVAVVKWEEGDKEESLNHIHTFIHLATILSSFSHIF